MVWHAESCGKIKLDIVPKGSMLFKEQFNTKPINYANIIKQGPNPWPHSCRLCGNSLRVYHPTDLRSDLYVNKTHGEVSGGKSPGRIWHGLIDNSLRVLSSLAINDNGLKWQVLDDKNSKGIEPQKSNDINLKWSINHNESRHRWVEDDSPTNQTW